MKRQPFSVFSMILLGLGLSLGFGVTGSFASNLSLQSELHVRADLLPAPGLDGKGKWTHGGYIRSIGQAGSLPTFYIFDSAGNLASSVLFNVPSADALHVYDFDLGSDGAIALCGQSGSGGRYAPFLALISSDGQSSQIIRTALYHPYLVAKASDGTIWTLGYEWGVNGNQHAPGIDYSNEKVLRHFDANGNFLGSVLPRGSFRPFDMEYGFLKVTKDRIALYTPGFGQSQYIEISLDGSAVHKYPGLNRQSTDGSAGPHISGFALTEDGKVFITKEPSTLDDTRKLLTLDRTNGRWNLVGISTFQGTSIPILKGSKGSLLAFTDRDRSSIRFFSVSP